MDTESVQFSWHEHRGIQFVYLCRLCSYCIPNCLTGFQHGYVSVLSILEMDVNWPVFAKSKEDALSFYKSNPWCQVRLHPILTSLRSQLATKLPKMEDHSMTTSAFKTHTVFVFWSKTTSSFADRISSILSDRRCTCRVWTAECNCISVWNVL